MAVSMAEITAEITADTSDFDSKMASAGQQVDALSEKGAATGRNLQTVGVGLTAIGAGAAVGFADVVGAAGNFEASLNNIQALTGATQAEMAGLGDLALQIGQDTAFSAQEGAQAIAELGKSGVPIPDIMDGAAMAVADLAAAGEVDMARAAEVMGAAMNTFGIAGEDAADVGDILAAGANKSAASINDLAFGMAQAGAGAAALGIPLEDTVATLAAFADRGLQGSDAGTSMKTMLASLTPSTKKAKEEFISLGLATAELNDAGETIIHNKFFDEQGNFVGMAEASNLLYDALKDMTQEQRAMALETLFGSDASRAAAILFDTQADAASGAGDSIEDYIAAMQPAGQATDVANAKMKGMNGAMEALRGSIDTLKITMGTGLTPVIEKAADFFSMLVNAMIGLPAPVQTAITAFTGLVAILAGGLGGAILIVPKILEFQKAMQALGVASKLAGVAFGPLGIALAAVGLAVVAYQTNFLGFADAVNKVAGNVQSLLTPALQAIQGTIDAVRASFEQWISQGFDPVSAAFLALMDVFPQFSGAIQTVWQLVENFTDTLRGIGAGLSDAIAALANGDLGSVLQGLFDAAMAAVGGFLNGLSIIGSAILQAFQAIDWGAVSSALLTGLQNASTALQTWFQEQSDNVIAGFNAIDWGAVGGAISSGLQTAVSAVGEIASTVVAKLGDLAAALVAWVTGAVSTIDWGSLWDGVSDVTATIITALGDLAAALLGWVTDAVAGVDWATQLTSSGVSLLTGLQDGITTKWPDIETWFGTLGSLIVDAVGDFATLLLGKGVEVFTSLNDGFQQQWPTIQAWLQTLGENIVNSVGDFAQLLLQKGIDVFTSLSDGFNAKWPDVQSWLQTLGQLISDAVGSLLETLREHGTEAITGLYTAAGEYWTGTVAPWLQSIPTLIVSTVGSLLATLSPQGTDVITGFKSGIDAKWTEVIAWLQSVPSLIGNAIGDLSGILFEKGAQLIGGLISGITSKIPDLNGALNAVAGAVGGVAGGVQGLFNTGVSQGGSYSDGLASGIASGAPAVQNAAGMVGQTAISEVAAVGGVHSPSTVMFGIGQDYISGLLLGAEDMRSDLESAFEQLATLVLDIFDRLQAGVLAAMDATVEGVKDAAAEAADAAAALHKTATSVGGVEPGDRAAKEQSYNDAMRDQDRADRRQRHDERQAERATRHGGSGSGNTYIENVNLRDERDLMRWARQQQRQSGLAGVRG